MPRVIPNGRTIITLKALYEQARTGAKRAQVNTTNPCLGSSRMSQQVS
jgi:hypothetical protein